MDINVNKAFEDYEKMTLQQFKTCSSMLENGNEGIMCVRCNYGTSIIMSLFGAEMFFVDEKTNSHPTSKLDRLCFKAQNMPNNEETQSGIGLF